jgi:hypothetical protein
MSWMVMTAAFGDGDQFEEPVGGANLTVFELEALRLERTAQLSSVACIFRRCARRLLHWQEDGPPCPRPCVRQAPPIIETTIPEPA